MIRLLALEIRISDTGYMGRSELFKGMGSKLAKSKGSFTWVAGDA